MDGDRPVVDGRDIFECRIQDYVRDLRKTAWKQEGLNENLEKALEQFNIRFRRLVVKAWEDGYATGRNNTLSYLDGSTGDVGDGVRSERHLANAFMCEFMEGFAEGIRDRSAQLETNGAFQHNLSEIKKTFRYSFKEFDDILPSTKPQVDEAF